MRSTANVELEFNAVCVHMGRQCNAACNAPLHTLQPTPGELHTHRCTGLRLKVLRVAAAEDEPPLTDDDLAPGIKISTRIAA
jgi:hypothetical protein